MNLFDDEEKLKLITKKGIYSYDYIDSFDRFHETELPSKDKFFSRLKQTNISTEEYLRAKLILLYLFLVLNVFMRESQMKLNWIQESLSCW